MRPFLLKRRRTSALVLLGAAACAGALVVLLLRGQSPRHRTQTHALGAPPVSRPSSPATGLFSANSVWNAPLPTNAPVDATSAELVSALDQEVASELRRRIGPWIATSLASTPLYIVSAHQPRVRIQLLNGPQVPGRAALQSAFDAVPVPANAKPAAGPDRHMTLWQPSTDTLWEFFKAERLADRWYAEWGGAIRRVSASPGYYGPAAWPGATWNWGATATSLPVIGGVILLQDLRAGEINHALAINLPAPRSGVFAWPAQRSDGLGGPTTIPEGARLRLDPSLNLSQFNMPRLTRMIAEAAQRYGMIVRDQTGHGVSLFGQDPTPLHLPKNPYYAPGGAYQGLLPSQILERFPWNHVQVLKLHLCVRAPCLP